MMLGKSWQSSASITITSVRIARWQIGPQRHSRSCIGRGRKNLVHRWSARNPHETRPRGLQLPKISSPDWYRKWERFVALVPGLNRSCSRREDNLGYAGGRGIRFPRELGGGNCAYLKTGEVGPFEALLRTKIARRRALGDGAGCGASADAIEESSVETRTPQ